MGAVCIARDVNRFKTQDIIPLLFEEFVELHGDRHFGDGAGAMIVHRTDNSHCFFSYCDSIGDLAGSLTAKGIQKDGLYTTIAP